MIHFNELYITDDGSQLIVDAEIDNADIYEGCYLENITIQLGEDCGTNNNVVAWESKKQVVGDFDNDGLITDHDYTLYLELYNAINVARKKIKYDSELDEYYYITREESDVRVKISKLALDLYDYIALHYDDPYNLGRLPEDLSYKLAAYLAEQFALAGQYEKLFGRPYDENNPCDFDGDNDPQFLSDINVFINVMLGLYGKDKDGNTIGDATEMTVESEHRKHVHLCFTNTDEAIVKLLGLKANIADHIYIVKAEAVCDGNIGEAAKELGCGWDKKELTGVAFQGYPLYSDFMGLINNYSEDCDSNTDELVDYILRYYAFEFALRNGDWCQAAYYWKNYFKNGSALMSNSFKGCGCHGTY